MAPEQTRKDGAMLLCRSGSVLSSFFSFFCGVTSKMHPHRLVFSCRLSIPVMPHFDDAWGKYCHRTFLSAFATYRLSPHVSSFSVSIYFRSFLVIITVILFCHHNHCIVLSECKWFVELKFIEHIDPALSVRNLCFHRVYACSVKLLWSKYIAYNEIQ